MIISSNYIINCLKLAVSISLILSAASCVKNEGYDFHKGLGYDIGMKEYFSGALDEIMEFDEYIVAKQVVGDKPVPLPYFRGNNYYPTRPPYPEGLNHTYYYIRNKYDNQGAGPLTYKEFLDTCKVLHLRLF